MCVHIIRRITYKILRVCVRDSRLSRSVIVLGVFCVSVFSTSDHFLSAISTGFFLLFFFVSTCEIEQDNNRTRYTRRGYY